MKFYAYIDVDNCINVRVYNKTYKSHHDMMKIRKKCESKNKYYKQFIDIYEADSYDEAVKCAYEINKETVNVFI